MTNTNIRTFLYILPLLVMACTLTAQATPQDGRGAVIAQTIKPTEQTATASPTLSPAPNVCHVKTGIDAGALNLRTCGGIDCPVLIVLHEGETVTQTEQKPVNGWIEVMTANGWTGWVNSNYTDCPAENAGLK